MHAMSKTLQRLIQTGVILLSLLATSAYADALDDAKSSGQIGEKQDGYIGLVQQGVPAPVVTLVAEVNVQRKQRYEQIAKQNNIPASEVIKLAFSRAIENTKSGNYIESSPGQWTRKP
jgi:uncharacterized protein YdbL (DUF1318 family)